MKSKIYFGFLFLIISKAFIYAQCSYPVTHINGAQVINDVVVTVSSSGSVYNYSTFGCQTYPINYFIGYNSLDGSYTYSFSPPVSSLSLNFFRLDNHQVTPPSKEEVQLFVNGNHYAIPAPGSSFSNCNGTDSIPAVITPEGNIAANAEYGSMKDLIINGPIQTLTVLVKIISGLPLGAFVSLFICDGILNINEYDNPVKPLLVPNPFTDKAEIRLPIGMGETTATLSNIQGQILKVYQSADSKIIINRDNLASGVYLVTIQTLL